MDESPADSLVFSEPGVGDDSSQYGREVAEAAEGMVDRGGQVLVPVQVGEEVKSQQRCEHTHTHTQTTVSCLTETDTVKPNYFISENSPPPLFLPWELYFIYFMIRRPKRWSQVWFWFLNVYKMMQRTSKIYQCDGLGTKENKICMRLLWRSRIRCFFQRWCYLSPFSSVVTSLAALAIITVHELLE